MARAGAIANAASRLVAMTVRRGSGRAAEVVVLLMMLAALILVVLYKGRCARAVGQVFEQLDSQSAPSAIGR